MASIPFVSFGREQKREDANVTIEKSIQLQQVIINNWFEERMANIQALSGLSTVKAFELERMETAFESFNESHPEFEGVAFVNEEGIVEIHTNGYTGIDLSYREYFKEAKKGNAFITDVIIERRTQSQSILFSNPIYDSDDNFKGAIIGIVGLTIINNIMNQFQDDSSETFIVDRNGMLITESRQSESGGLIRTEIYEKALAGKPIRQLYETKNGEKVLGNYRWVHNDQWLIIGEIKESKIYEPFYRMALMFSIVILLGTVIGYILLRLVIAQIENPIRKVLEGTRKIGERNFNYRLDRTLYEKEAIEFQELCEHFNVMNELIESHIVTLEKNEERFQMITEHSSDMITIHDLTGKYLYVSHAGKETLQYEDEELIGHDSYLFIHPDDLEKIRSKHEELMENGYAVSTYRIRRKDGEYIWLESSVKCLTGKTEELQLIIISRNITERKLAEQKLQEANLVLKELSAKDGLTGIWNRRTFDEQLEIEWYRSLINSDAHTHPLSLIMLDIDQFKKFNDTYGHQAGDDCLKKVANAIEQTARKTGDMVFRYGGEEFSVLLPETDLEGAVVVAERIRKVVENLAIPHSGSEVSQFVTISLGVHTIIPNEERTMDQLIVEADKALYQAKQSGRNRCIPSMEQ